MHPNQLPEAHPDEQLIDGLEPDQIVASAAEPFPRLRIGPAGEACLWALRIFVLIITALVVYTFIVALPSGS